MRENTMVRAVRILLIALVAGSFLAACGDDNKSSSDSSDTTVASAAPAELNVVGKDFSYATAASVKAGFVKVSLDNQGQEPHQVQLVRINDGVTPQQLQEAQTDQTGEKLLPLVTVKGGVNGIAPGTKQSAVTKLDAGQYLMLCFLRGADGVAHAAKGMVAPFTVSAPATKAAEPKYGSEVEAKDFSFTLPTFKAGEQTIELKNAGPSPHEMTLYRVADGKTAADVQNALSATTPPTGPPPFVWAGGGAAVAPGTSTFPTLDLKPGTYVVTCFVPDPKTGKPHIALGMFSSFDVK
jgi:hypothetical protein